MRPGCCADEGDGDAGPSAAEETAACGLSPGRRSASAQPTRQSGQAEDADREAEAAEVG